MIMNNFGGGSGVAPSGSTTTRMVGLSEIAFFYYDYENGRRRFAGEDVVNSGKGYKTFYLPGKVLNVLSFKYRRKINNGNWGDVITYNGDWELFGNQATPQIEFTKSSNDNYWYDVTEFTALIEDQVVGGTTYTFTIEVPMSSSTNQRITNVLLPHNAISVLNISANSYPSGSSNPYDCISYGYILTGSVFKILPSYRWTGTLTVTVNMAVDDRFQGILMYKSTSTSRDDMVNGFKPKLYFAGQNSPSGTPSGQLYLFTDSMHSDSSDHSGQAGGMYSVYNGTSTSIYGGAPGIEYNESTKTTRFTSGSGGSLANISYILLIG